MREGKTSLMLPNRSAGAYMRISIDADSLLKFSSGVALGLSRCRLSTVDFQLAF